jgi:hypothetical protein
MTVALYSVTLPDYRVNTEPDFFALGRTLDALIVRHFPRRRLAIRGLSLVDHPGTSTLELMEIIARLGTDRYDPTRQAVLESFYAPYRLDLHALPCETTADGRLYSSHDDGAGVMAGLLSDFFHGPPLDRGAPPMRLDLLTVYDRDHLEAVAVDHGDGGDEDPCEFRFLHPDRKSEALLGMVQLQ